MIYVFRRYGSAVINICVLCECCVLRKILYTILAEAEYRKAAVRRISQNKESM